MGLGKEDRRAQVLPQALWALGQSLGFTPSPGELGKGSEGGVATFLLPHLLAAPLARITDPSSTRPTLLWPQGSRGHRRARPTHTDTARPVPPDPAPWQDKEEVLKPDSPEAAQPSRHQEREGRSPTWLEGRYGGAGTWKRMGFCHCRHLTSSFLGLKRPRAPSGQRGAEAGTGVHKREPRRGSHTASVTGKLQFPTVIRSLPPLPTHTQQYITGVLQSHTKPLGPITHMLSTTSMLQPHPKSQK